jgi:Flp pilus assembly protein TadD
MHSKILIFALAALALSSAGCIELRQPKEFKNRKMKEDPPQLNQLPLQAPQRVASHQVPTTQGRA